MPDSFAGELFTAAAAGRRPPHHDARRAGKEARGATPSGGSPPDFKATIASASSLPATRRGSAGDDRTASKGLGEHRVASRPPGAPNTPHGERLTGRPWGKAAPHGGRAPMGTPRRPPPFRRSCLASPAMGRGVWRVAVALPSPSPSPAMKFRRLHAVTCRRDSRSRARRRTEGRRPSGGAAALELLSNLLLGSVGDLRSPQLAVRLRRMYAVGQMPRRALRMFAFSTPSRKSMNQCLLGIAEAPKNIDGRSTASRCSTTGKAALASALADDCMRSRWRARPQLKVDTTSWPSGVSPSD